MIQKPFVVIGDESLETVKKRADKTVRWAAEKLKKLYFTKEPNEILDIWLFKNKESYIKYTKEIFDDRPTTPFGYYSHRHKALIMNIATGGGTLVHEIVHPYIASNFADCPSWFNEGLASLYEQCGEENGRIHGYTNWRLRGLQQAIKNEQVHSFKTLCSTTTHQFYNTNRGTNYAQARYLCYNLQQKCLLVKFYRKFRNKAKTDPTGYDTLRKVLDSEDMARFQKTWEKYVSTLR